jgi:hypothetical protein
MGTTPESSAYFFIFDLLLDAAGADRFRSSNGNWHAHQQLASATRVARFLINFWLTTLGGNCSQWLPTLEERPVSHGISMGLVASLQ